SLDLRELSLAGAGIDYPEPILKAGVPVNARLVSVNGDFVGSRVGLQRALKNSPEGPWRLVFETPEEDSSPNGASDAAQHTSTSTYRRIEISTEYPINSIVFMDIGYPRRK